MSTQNETKVGNVNNPSAVVFFLHGLGDTPAGWAEQCSQLQTALPHVLFRLPRAPTQKVTCNYNMAMTSWMDLTAIPITPTTPDNGKHQEESLRLMFNKIDEAINEGIDPSRIVVGGFSQGAALALATVVRFPKQLGGCFALSGWSLPKQKFAERVPESQNKNTPFFLGHGTSDGVVLSENANQTEHLLKNGGVINVEKKFYSGMAHSSCPQEIRDLVKFLNKCIPHTISNENN